MTSTTSTSRVRTAVFALVFTAVATLASASAAPAMAWAAAAEETITVVSTDTGQYPTVKMVVAAPPSLAAGELPASAFQVLENGKARSVTVESLPAEQLEVVLVVDTSWSMNGAPLTAAKSAAQSLLGQLPPAVPVAIVGFGATPTVISPASVDRAAQSAAISKLTASGETALYDALTTASAQFSPAGGARRMMVALSDGGDTRSKATLKNTIDAMLGAKASLFAVELKTPDSNPDALSQLATATGGKVVPATDPAALAGAFDVVAKQLIRQYAISFKSEAKGNTDLEIIIEASSTRASSHHRVTIPGAEPAKTTAAESGATQAADSSSASGTWLLWAGAAFCAAALAAMLMGVLAFRAPRARGLGRRKVTALSEAAARAERIGETALRADATSALMAKLDAAGLEMRPGELVVTVAAGALAALALGWWMANPIFGLALAGFVLLAAKVVVEFLADRRRQQFADQLGETLQLLSGALRAGHALAQAMDTVAREADSPTSTEFRRVTIETRLGRDSTEALMAMSDRMGSQDFEWVVQAIDIHRDVGGDLAEIFDSLANTIRDRNRIRRQVRALSAEGRMSAYVLMVLPLGLGAFMSVTNPEYLRPLYTTTGGYVMLVAGGLLLAGGGLWLRKIVKPVF